MVTNLGEQWFPWEETIDTFLKKKKGTCIQLTNAVFSVCENIVCSSRNSLWRVGFQKSDYSPWIIPSGVGFPWGRGLEVKVPHGGYEGGPKWQICSDCPSCSDSAEICHADSFSVKKCPCGFFDSQAGKQLLQTRSWKSTHSILPPYLTTPLPPLPPPPPPPPHTHTHTLQ